MEEYYHGQAAKLHERKLKVDKIHNLDQEQAIEYQKKLHGFEHAYFEKLTAAVKEAS